MKIGILTYYGVHNHGAVLQANALQSVLKSMGHSVCFLSFDRSYEYISVEQAKKYKVGLSSIPFYVKYMSEKGYGNILFNLRKRRSLDIYRDQFFDIETECSKYVGDAIIIGSDEVFSLEIGYNPMMYGWGLRAPKVISYAGSFGPTTMEDIFVKEKAEVIRNGLERFRAISVRDINSKYIMKNICKQDVSVVCDPVILYGYQSEMQAFIPKEKNYILIYSYDNRMNDEIEVDRIRQYARKHRLKLYSVGFFHKWCDKSINVSPIELLGWIRNANCVITDTFHGAVMSIICNTLFVVKLRDNANKLQYLLKEYDLEERIVDSFNDLERVISNPINFQRVNEKLDVRRKESIRFLEEALK